MKTLLILSSLMVIALAPQAHAETCQGKTHVPAGEFSWTAESGANGPSSIRLKFHNDALDEDFSGTLHIGYFDPKSGGIVGKGVLRNASGNVEAGIQGSLSPDEAGEIVLAVYAQGDHRIEYGYGLWLSCKAEDRSR
jgi:hypothetical protein